MLRRGFGGRSADGRGAIAGGGLSLPLAAGLLVLSGVLNALQLSTSLLVLHLYDRVLPSRSPAGLAALVGLMLALHAGFALLDLVRARVLCRAGLAFVQDLDRRALDALRAGGAARPGLEALGDVDRVGRFLTNAGPAAFLDAVWLPACLAALCLLHPALALFAAAGIALLGGLAVAAEARSREAAQRIADVERRRLALVPTVRAGSAYRWHALSRSVYRLKGKAAQQALAVGALGKGLRLMLMSGGLGLGALLVMAEAMTAGTLVASSVILGRTFSALDQALAHWRSFVAARASYRRLVASFPDHAGEIAPHTVVRKKPAAQPPHPVPLPAGERGRKAHRPISPLPDGERSEAIERSLASVTRRGEARS